MIHYQKTKEKPAKKINLFFTQIRSVALEIRMLYRENQLNANSKTLAFSQGSVSYS